jgi:hypothetical protein
MTDSGTPIQSQTAGFLWATLSGGRAIYSSTRTT